MLQTYVMQMALASLQMAFGHDAQSVQDIKSITSPTDMRKAYACPRCRRAKPPGPLKRPSPGYKREKKNDK